MLLLLPKLPNFLPNSNPFIINKEPAHTKNGGQKIHLRTHNFPVSEPAIKSSISQQFPFNITNTFSVFSQVPNLKPVTVARKPKHRHTTPYHSKPFSLKTIHKDGTNNSGSLSPPQIKPTQPNPHQSNTTESITFTDHYQTKSASNTITINQKLIQIPKSQLASTTLKPTDLKPKSFVPTDPHQQTIVRVKSRPSKPSTPINRSSINEQQSTVPVPIAATSKLELAKEQTQKVLILIFFFSLNCRIQG